MPHQWRIQRKISLLGKEWNSVIGYTKLETSLQTILTVWNIQEYMSKWDLINTDGKWQASSIRGSHLMTKQDWKHLKANIRSRVFFALYYANTTGRLQQETATHLQTKGKISKSEHQAYLHSVKN